ncbi:hypothetical protein C8Q80DRAFT_674703 [Daedaleopsis nitida]|nr:hypothetical protein C8Q80DRAFT_674703 [Daedaleopsis nitida]
MSISSTSIRSTSGCSCGSDVWAGGATSKTSWRAEIQGRVHWFPGPFEHFLDDLVPCSVPYTLTNDITDAFAGYKPGKGKEISSYEGLNAGLNKLVESFGDRKIEFYDTHGSAMRFPFDTFAKQHAISYPDLCASWPGETIPKEAFEKKKSGEKKTDENSVIWQQLAMIGEVKAERKDNPFPRKGEVNADTVVKLARCARNLLLANGLLATFVLGIYEDILHVARFDHSSAIVSPPINFKEEPQLLQRFLWHLTHPLVGDTIVGCDPSIHRLTNSDRDWVANQLKTAGVADVDAELAEFYKGRKVDVPNSLNGATTPYICYRLLDVNARLFSRATTVWLTLEDTRVMGLDGALVDKTPPVPSKIRIMKEAWRQLVRKPESAFYERLADTIPDGERKGLAKLVCGGDLGELEVLNWETTSPKASQCMEGQRDLRVTSPEGHAPPGPPCVLPYPQHQTFSWTIGRGDPAWTYRERSHMRFVVDVVGRPITKARNTKQVVMALRDAIIGHRLAWEKGGVLHRDVSLGNILIIDANGGEHDFVGFLHDFDYSAMTDSPPGSKPDKRNEHDRTSGEPDDLPLSDDPEDSEVVRDGIESTETPKDDQRKERTGTFYFMAIEILLLRVVHGVHHDLESFYWVLLWVVLRHTEHNLDATIAQNIFVFKNDDSAAQAKRGWLYDKAAKFDIPNNPALSQLMRDLGVITCRGTPIPFVTPVLLKYDAILAIIDAALEKDWPEIDLVPCKWFDRSGQSVVPGVTSDNHPEEPIPAPVAAGSQSRSQAELMPPPASTETRAMRSKRRADAVQLEDTPQAATSSQGTSDSSKRRRTAGSRAASSNSTIVRSGSNIRSTGHSGSRSGLRSKTRAQQS